MILATTAATARPRTALVSESLAPRTTRRRRHPSAAGVPIPTTARALLRVANHGRAHAPASRMASASTPSSTTQPTARTIPIAAGRTGLPGRPPMIGAAAHAQARVAAPMLMPVDRRPVGRASPTPSVDAIGAIPTATATTERRASQRAVGAVTVACRPARSTRLAAKRTPPSAELGVAPKPSLRARPLVDRPTSARRRGPRSPRAARSERGAPSRRPAARNASSVGPRTVERHRSISVADQPPPTPTSGPADHQGATRHQRRATLCRRARTRRGPAARPGTSRSRGRGTATPRTEHLLPMGRRPARARELAPGCRQASRDLPAGRRSMRSNAPAPAPRPTVPMAATAAAAPKAGRPVRSPPAKGRLSLSLGAEARAAVSATTAATEELTAAHPTLPRTARPAGALPLAGQPMTAARVKGGNVGWSRHGCPVAGAPRPTVVTTAPSTGPPTGAASPQDRPTTRARHRNAAAPTPGPQSHQPQRMPRRAPSDASVRPGTPTARNRALPRLARRAPPLHRQLGRVGVVHLGTTNAQVELLARPMPRGIVLPGGPPPTPGQARDRTLPRRTSTTDGGGHPCMRAKGCRPPAVDQQRRATSAATGSSGLLGSASRQLTVVASAPSIAAPSKGGRSGKAQDVPARQGRTTGTRVALDGWTTTSAP